MTDDMTGGGPRQTVKERSSWGGLRSSSTVGEANNKAVRRRRVEQAERVFELNELEKKLRRQGLI